MDPQVEKWLRNVYEVLGWEYEEAEETPVGEQPPRGEQGQQEQPQQGEGPNKGQDKGQDKGQESEENDFQAQAQLIRDDPLMNEVVAHATFDETEQVRAIRGYIEEALSRDVLTASDIKAAQRLLAGLGPAIKSAQAAVQERLQIEANSILEHANMTSLPPDANSDELANAHTARAKVRLILNRKPLAPRVIEDARKLFELIGPALERARQAAVDRLAKEAEAIREHELMQQTVPHATGDEIKDVLAARNRILNELDATPLATLNVVTARNVLPELGVALTAARLAVRERLRNEADRIRNDERMFATVEGTAENDLAQAQTARAKVRLILERSPLAPQDIEDAEALLNTIDAGLEKARELVAERKKKADSIRNDSRMKDTVAGATEDDMQPVIATRQSITELLSQSPLSATHVAKADERLVKNLTTDLETAKKVVKERRETAERIRNDARMKEVVANATEDDVKEIVTQRRAILELLDQKPLSAKNVQDANVTLTKELDGALTTAKDEIRKRKETADRIRNDARMKDAVAGATDDDMKEVVTLRRAIIELLNQKPLSAKNAQDASNKLAQELDGAVTAAKEKVRKRKEAADQVRDDNAMKAKVDAATREDLQPLVDARQKVTDFLKVSPLTDDAVEKAKLELPAVKLALEQLTKLLQERQEQAELLLTAVRSDQPLYQGPEGAFPHQVAAIQQQCGVVSGKLNVKPLSAQALRQAQDEKKKLDELYKDIEDAVATLGKDKTQELVQALGQQKIAALQQAFNFADAKKLAAFIQDIGGKAPLQNLLGTFTPAELKTVCDNFGGARCAEQLLTVGCGGNAADLKKLNTLFNTQQDRQNIQGLVGTGGLGANPVVLGKTLDAAIQAERVKALDRKKQQALQLNPSANVSGMTLTPTERITADDEGRKQLKGLATAFANPDDQKRLASLLDAGGLGKNPATLGAILQTGYNGNATNFRDLSRQFPVPDPTRLQNNDPGAQRSAKNLQDLKGVLTRGGLGERPEVFAHLLPPNGTATVDKLKDFCAEFSEPTDQDKLRDLARNGLGGTPPESARRMALVLKDGVGGRPQDLKTLHAAFNVTPPPGTDLPKMKSLFDAFATPPPPNQVGKRLERVTGKVASLNAVKTTYYDGISKNVRSGAASKVTDCISSNGEMKRAVQQAAGAKKLADEIGATDETKQGAAAVQAALEAHAAAALAGAGVAPTDAIADGLASTITKSANAGEKIAAMGAKVATLANAARDAARQEVLIRQPPVSTDRIDAEVQLLEDQHKQAAILAASQAQQAITAAQQAAQRAALATATTLDLQNARDAALTAANAAEAAVRAAELTSDEATLKNALAKAADAAKVAAETAAAAAARHAASNAKTQSDQAANKLNEGGGNAIFNPVGVDWQGKSESLDKAGAAQLAAIVAADPQARKLAVEAAQLADVARQTSLDANATPDEIAAARQAAQQAATLAASDAARAARLAAIDAPNNLPPHPTVPTPGQLAAVIAAADAASAAGLAANDTAAINAANAAYDAAKLASRRSTTYPERAVGGGALLQKRKANGRTGAPPKSLQDVLRIGSTFNKRNLNEVANDAQLGNGPPPNFYSHESDQKHVCGRHTRDYFTFGPQELPAEDEMIQACLMTSWTDGYPLGQYEIDVIAQLDTKAKKTTLFPEGVSKAQVKQYVENAIQYIRGAGPGPSTGGYNLVGPQGHLSLTSSWVQWNNIPVGDGYQVTIGLKRLSGRYKVAQMYPTSGPGLETVDYFDMRAIKKGLNA